MNNSPSETPALLIIDMVKDTFDERRNYPITALAKGIIEPIRRLAASFRAEGWPVVFATDAFKEGDFIFTGRMKPYSLEGTAGAEVIDELGRGEKDLWLPKPRFSAFFKTPLEGWLKDRNVTLCAVCGVTTPFCVLSTAIDAVCCDFKAVILEDCAAAASEKVHRQTLDNYRKSALYPLLRVAISGDFVAEISPSERFNGP
jgi:nicotinamidase-related amidase